MKFYNFFFICILIYSRSLSFQNKSQDFSAIKPNQKVKIVFCIRANRSLFFFFMFNLFTPETGLFFLWHSLRSRLVFSGLKFNKSRNFSSRLFNSLLSFRLIKQSLEKFKNQILWFLIFRASYFYRVKLSVDHLKNSSLYLYYYGQ